MQSLRVKLIAPFLVGTLVLVLLLAWYTYASARQAMEDAMLLISEAKTSRAVDSMSLLTKSMSTNLQNMVVDPHVTALFAEEVLVPAVREKTMDWLEIITQGNEYYRDILILDKKGICVASSNPGHVGDSYANKAYVLQALSGRFTLSEFTVGRVTKRFSSVAAGPVDVAGEVRGALILLNDFPKIVDYDASARHDDQTISTAMLTSEGLFTAHRDREFMGNDKRLFPELYGQLALVGEQGNTVQYSLLGEEYIGYARVEPVSDWVVLTSGRKAEVFAPAYRVGLAVLGISFAFLAGISFMILRFANGILRTLLSLINYAKNVSEGAIDLKLEDSRRNDELGILHSALQRLVQSLESMLVETQKASTMKGQFLANMSHEIRTPLNAIIGMTHLSLRDTALPDRQRGYLDKIMLAAKSLLGLINDILDLSKIEAGMLELEDTPFNLRETLRDLLTIHQDGAVTKHLTLTLEYDPDVPERFIGDPLRIGQVVNNLLSNAIKFTSVGGVRVACTLEAINEQDGREQALVRVSVRDSGIGISSETLASLFRPFTQADASISRQFGGTGLGLAISDRIVQLLGGAFCVDSVPGKGTDFSFTMRLPINPDATSSPVEELPLDEAFAQLNLSGKRILIAEDNAINQLIMQEMLAPCGATLIMTDNGQQAVDAARSQKFDLVFMDMQMPIMGGLEATRYIREFADGEALPIIAVTANAMKEDKDLSFAGGMNDYITKPIEPRQLLDVLRLWLTG